LGGVVNSAGLIVVACWCSIQYKGIVLVMLLHIESNAGNGENLCSFAFLLLSSPTTGSTLLGCLIIDTRLSVILLNHHRRPPLYCLSAPTLLNHHRHRLVHCLHRPYWTIIDIVWFTVCTDLTEPSSTSPGSLSAPTLDLKPSWDLGVRKQRMLQCYASPPNIDLVSMWCYKYCTLCVHPWSYCGMCSWYCRDSVGLPLGPKRCALITWLDLFMQE
jgi:hypothetical protein